MKKEDDLKDACWKGYKAVGLKKKGDKMVPNCVPEGTVESLIDWDQRTNVEKSIPEGVHRDRADALISKEKDADTLKFDRMRDTADSQDDAEQKRIKAKIKEDTSISIPLYVQEAAYEGNIGMMELAKFYMKASDSDKKKLQDAIKNKRFKEAWKMVERVTGVKLVGKEFSEAVSPAQQAAIAIAKKKKQEVEEEVAANSVAGGGVDMNPTGKPKWDKRSKFHIDHMFRRADGTKYKKEKKN